MSPDVIRPERLSVATRTMIVAASLILGVVYLASALRAEEVPPRQSLASLPMTVDRWTGRREPDFTPQILKVLGVDDYVVRAYFRADALPVGLYVGYYSSQRQGDTIHSPLNCLPGAGWQPIEQSRIVISTKGAPGHLDTTTPVEVNRVVIAKGIDQQLVYYWYQSHGRVVASEYWGKIYTVLDSVRYHRTDAALVRIVVPIREPSAVGEADQTATRFVQSLFPLLAPHLPV